MLPIRGNRHGYTECMKHSGKKWYADMLTYARPLCVERQVQTSVIGILQTLRSREKVYRGAKAWTIFEHTCL